VVGEKIKFGDMGIWGYGIMGIWDYGDMGLGDMALKG
jgi:hypothetical protein